MRKGTLKAIREHAVRDFPREACGLVLMKGGKEKYKPCRNISIDSEDSFAMDPEDYAAAEVEGEIIAVVHSHPNASAKPSAGDLVSIEEEQLPFFIISVYKDLLTGEVVAGDHTITAPSGYEAPLVGRTWCPPQLDCYSIVRDYYQRTLDITLPDFETVLRTGAWWEDRNNESLYVKHFESAGFVRVDGPPKEHDVIIMTLQSQAGPNHSAIYLGDETGHILHHLYGRLSGRAPYGGYWLDNTHMIVRHKEML